MLEVAEVISKNSYASTIRFSTYRTDSFLANLHEYSVSISSPFSAEVPNSKLNRSCSASQSLKALYYSHQVNKM